MCVSILLAFRSFENFLGLVERMLPSPAVIVLNYVLIASAVSTFRPLACRLHPDNIAVYAMSIHFNFQALQQIDTLIIQCSRLLNGRDFSSFSSQKYPLQDVDVIRTNAQDLDQLIVSSLIKGTLYHCRCISENSGQQYKFISPILSTTTRNAITWIPVLHGIVTLTRSENDKSIRLRWNPLGQDVDKVTLQISNKIPPNWMDHSVEMEGDVAALFQYDVGILNFNNGEAYNLRMKFSNQNGTGYSNVLSFVVPC